MQQPRSGPRPGPRNVGAWGRRHTVELATGLLTVGIGGLELLVRSRHGYESTGMAFVLLLGAVTALARVRPGLSLASVWATGVLQVVVGVPLLLAQALLLHVAFATARWGGRWTLVAGAVSVPAGVAVAAVALGSRFYSPGLLVEAQVTVATNLLGSSMTSAFLIALLVLAAAWLAGLAARFRATAVASRRERLDAERESARAHRETAQAYEIARLREEQTRLARDVHDVVGHSLAVILAQAESGQFLPDDDPVALKSTLQTIAGSARSSLRDVQHVLSATPVPPGQLHALVQGAVGTGFTIDARTTGMERALPPELAAVAHRVLQEMLTNALKHGDRSAPLTVLQRWPEGAGEELELVVRNGIPAGRPKGPSGGLGLEGIQHRLHAVGGRLQVEAGPTRFCLTARVPVRS